MKDKVLTFNIFDDDGKKIECEELYSFVNEENGKNYIIYTDNTLDDDGNLKVYGAIHDENDKLIPITDDSEWAYLEETLDLLEDGNE